MHSSCSDLYDWVNQDKSNAKLFVKAVESAFRRNIILIVDEHHQALITCFSANKKKRRIIN